jgi:ribonuclease P protein component
LHWVQVKRSFRLTKSADVQRVRRSGKSYAHPFLVLLAQPSEFDQTRIGVAAGRAVGNAVQRNRAKRVLRAATSPLIPRITSGYDLLLIARKPILTQKSPAVQAALEQKLTQAGLLGPPILDRDAS